MHKFVPIYQYTLNIKQTNLVNDTSSSIVVNSLSIKLLLVSTYNPGFWTGGYHGPLAPPQTPQQCPCPLHSESLCWWAQ